MRTEFRRLPAAPSLVGLRPEPVPVSAIRRPSTIAKQQDHPRAAAHSISAGNSELEPDDRQKQGSGNTHQQGCGSQGFGGRTAFLASGVQRSQRDVRDESGPELNKVARVHHARATIAIRHERRDEHELRCIAAIRRRDPPPWSQTHVSYRVSERPVLRRVR